MKACFKDKEKQNIYNNINNITKRTSKSPQSVKSANSKNSNYRCRDDGILLGI